MTGRAGGGTVVIAVVIALLALAACTSPEATRTRAGGPGGDTGNRGEAVRMHEGSEPYWSTPRMLADDVGAPMETVSRDGRSLGDGTPAASPR